MIEAAEKIAKSHKNMQAAHEAIDKCHFSLGIKSQIKQLLTELFMSGLIEGAAYAKKVGGHLRLKEAGVSTKCIEFHTYGDDADDFHVQE